MSGIPNGKEILAARRKPSHLIVETHTETPGSKPVGTSIGEGAITQPIPPPQPLRREGASSDLRRTAPTLAPPSLGREDSFSKKDGDFFAFGTSGAGSSSAPPLTFGGSLRTSSVPMTDYTGQPMSADISPLEEKLSEEPPVPLETQETQEFVFSQEEILRGFYEHLDVLYNSIQSMGEEAALQRDDFLPYFSETMDLYLHILQPEELLTPDSLSFFSDLQSRFAT